MTTSFPLSEREKLIDDQISKMNDTIIKLQGTQDNIEDYFVKIFCSIRRIEQHTGCDKSLPGLDEPAEGEK